MGYGNGIGSLQGAGAANQSDALGSVQPKRSDRMAITNGPSKADLSNEVHADLSATGALVAHALSGSDVQALKVAPLQQAISAGQYNVSALDVADKLLQTLLES